MPLALSWGSASFPLVSIIDEQEGSMGYLATNVRTGEEIEGRTKEHLRWLIDRTGTPPEEWGPPETWVATRIGPEVEHFSFGKTPIRKPWQGET